MSKMEFKLPFPTLQNLAVLTIAHSLMDLEVSRDSLVVNRAGSLRESLSKVDKLKVPEIQKCDIREVLKGTSDHLHNWCTSRDLDFYTHYSGSPRLQFNLYGCVDDVRMARSFLQKCYSDERHNNDFLALMHLLRVASYYVLLPDIRKILQKILTLRAEGSVVPQLEGPEYEIDSEDKLHLVYSFLDEQGAPMSFNMDCFDPFGALSLVPVCSSRFSINLSRAYYNPELFQLHWNLLEPSKRMPFVRSLLIKISSQQLVCQVLQILNVLDPASRQSYVEDPTDHEKTKHLLLKCLLVWPYQELFLPVFQLRELIFGLPIELFMIVVDKLNVMAFRKMLMPLWEAIPSQWKSFISGMLTEPDPVGRFRKFKDMLRKLSQHCTPMYERVVADLNLPLACLQETRKRRHESSSSVVDPDAYFSSMIKYFCNHQKKKDS